MIRTKQVRTIARVRVQTNLAQSKQTANYKMYTHCMMTEFVLAYTSRTRVVFVRQKFTAALTMLLFCVSRKLMGVSRYGCQCQNDAPA